MEIVTKEFYIVGGVTFDDKQLAQRIEGLIAQDPDNNKVCSTCKGTRIEKYIGTELTSDAYGYPSGHIAVHKQRTCPNCKDGVVRRVVTEQWS